MTSRGSKRNHIKQFEFKTCACEFTLQDWHAHTHHSEAVIENAKKALFKKLKGGK